MKCVMRIKILFCYLFLAVHCKTGNPYFNKNDSHDQNTSNWLKKAALANKLETPEYLEPIASKIAYFRKMNKYAQSLRLLNEDSDFDSKMKNIYNPKAYNYYSRLLN